MATFLYAEIKGQFINGELFLLGSYDNARSLPIQAPNIADDCWKIQKIQYQGSVHVCQSGPYFAIRHNLDIVSTHFRISPPSLNLHSLISFSDEEFLIAA